MYQCYLLYCKQYLNIDTKIFLCFLKRTNKKKYEKYFKSKHLNGF